MLDLIVLACGLLLLLLPKKMIVNESKLKPGQNAEKIVKDMRKYGMILVGIAIVLILINYL